MKANIKLPNGAMIEITDGTIDEINAVADHASKYPPAGSMPKEAMRPATQTAWRTPAGAQANGDAASPDEIDIAAVVRIIKECPEAEQLQARVLDAKPNSVNKTLMCLWAVSKYINDQIGLTSGDVEKITDQLNIKLDISAASRVLSDKAKAYVSGDTVRRKGGAVHYKLNRRGITEFERILKDGSPA
jgi:hypothetical protein